MGEGKFEIIDLVELQAIENAVSARYTEIEKVKSNLGLNEAENNLAASRQKNEEKNSQFHDLDVKRKKLEDSVDTHEEKIKKNESKLFSGTITDSKELLNYQEEIQMLKNNNSKLEDEILTIMEEQDMAKPGIEALKEEMTELDSIVLRIRSEMDEKLEGLKHNIEGLKKRKEDVVLRIPGDYLKKYNDLKTKKGGIAVSVIKDNFCNVCNMEIPSIETERFVESDQVYKCPLCGRMSVLYRPEMDDIKKGLEY
ncbi:MAG: hypothetical protein MUP02_11220 [Actinobacteria bacterium]|nr:hypothetical protein [Actinomycetota bacterium]